MKKFTLRLKTTWIIGLSLFQCAFSDPDNNEQYINFLQKTFVDHYDLNQERKQIKSFELNITNNGFCRYKRYFINGKTEYFAFKISKFKDLDYSGTNLSGKLCIRTKSDDIIVQTYKDKGGDVDSMTTNFSIPMKNLEAEDLIEIRDKFSRINVQPQ
ncbi:hypothetical protein ACJVDH_14545 [Pedobacter sp. AW1-32]|uniref:hypothetical protein n=1 Tax=Pedobacter sp. AW1-32 TaxID=3383026 RepID=UPI003FEFB397